MFQTYRLLTCSVGLLHIVYLLSIITPIASMSPIAHEQQMTTTKMTQDISQLKIKTPKPIIGVLTQVLRDYKRFTNEHHLHLVASYVKWIESAGAQVVPILLNKEDAYYEQIFKQTNGLLLPGGDNLLDPAKRTPMMVAAKKLYALAVKANDQGDYYPIWGTCLGLELLSVLTANRNVLESCSAIDESLTMKFVSRGRLFAPASYANLPLLERVDYSGAIVNALSTQNITYNFHHKCLTDEGLKRAGLNNFYRPLAYSKDSNNNKFIAIFEAINYPFFGVQFHPEKPPFEFVIKRHQLNVPHSREAIAVSRYFADFFVQQAQLNGHHVGVKKMQNELIYARNPMYTAPLHDMYEQRYLFPFGKAENPAALTEEFLEHVPLDGEDVPEEVSEAGKSGSQANSSPITTSKSNGIVEIELMQADDGLIGSENAFYLL